jgi:hypothetical protein
VIESKLLYEPQRKAERELLASLSSAFSVRTGGRDEPPERLGHPLSARPVRLVGLDAMWMHRNQSRC